MQLSTKIPLLNKNKNEKVKFLFLMSIIGLVFSCSNDSNEPEISKLEQNKLNIIGIWAPTSSVIENGTGTGESELD